MARECVVVKFHDKEKYAVAAYSGSQHECEVKAAYCRGLYHDVPEVRFGIYDAGHYDMCLDMERRGQGERYELLGITNYTERIAM